MDMNRKTRAIADGEIGLRLSDDPGSIRRTPRVGKASHSGRSRGHNPRIWNDIGSEPFFAEWG